MSKVSESGDDSIFVSGASDAAWTEERCLLFPLLLLSRLGG